MHISYQSSSTHHCPYPPVTCQTSDLLCVRLVAVVLCRAVPLLIHELCVQVASSLFGGRERDARCGR
eukprot:scaffold6018_cov110-Alexandrium_tamarense.AAC.1